MINTEYSRFGTDLVTEARQIDFYFGQTKSQSKLNKTYMNSFELTHAIDDFFLHLDEANPFIEAVSIFSGYMEKIQGQLELMAIGGNQLPQSANNIHTLFASFPSITTSINNRKFFHGFDNFSRALDILKATWTSKSDHFYALQKESEALVDLFDLFLSNKTPKSSYKLIFSSYTLQHSLKITFDLLASIRSTLVPDEILKNNESEISIVLPEQLSPKDFALRLLALQEIYSEMCHLFNVSEADNPLKIHKVESGSLWAWLFGNTKIVEAMIGSIKNSATWIYRNYTTEGRISNISMKVEAIDALLGLSQRLEDAGIDTANIKPNIEKSAIVISQQISTLLEGQSRITINHQTLSISAELEKKLLGQTKIPLLAANTENNHENQ